MSLSKRFIIPSAISVLVAMLPLLGMSFGYRFSFPMAAKEPPGNVSGLAVAPDPDIKALVLQVRPSGFTPNKVEVPAGKYLLVLQNRSGKRDLTFRVATEAGAGLYEAGTQQRLDWKRQLELRPGSYVLTEASHPEWQCAVRVTSR